MKDITHYFQSPNKNSDSSYVLSEDDVQIVRSPVVETKLSKQESVPSSDSEKKKKRKQKPRSIVSGKADTNSEGENSGTQSLQPLANGTCSSETSKISTPTSVKRKKEKKGVGDKSHQGKASDKNHRNGKIRVEKASSGGVSFNAFEVLMSTQQIFSSAQYTDKGKVDLVDVVYSETEENTEKTQTKKKRKENLERLAENKVKRKKLSVVTESEDCEPKRKKRKRRIVLTESDSESEESKQNKLSSNKSKRLYKPLEIITKSPRNRKVIATVEISQVESKPDKGRENEKKNGKMEIDGKQECVIESSEKPFKNDSGGESSCLSETFDTLDKIAPQREKIDGLDGTKQSIGSGKHRIEKKSSNSMKLKTENFSDQSGAEVTSRQSEKEEVPEVTLSNGIEQEVAKAEGSGDAKKRNSLFSYFSKVPNEGKNRHSDTIKVTADVHFPVKVAQTPSKTATTKKRKSKLKTSVERYDDIQIVDSEVIEVDEVLEDKLTGENKSIEGNTDVKVKVKKVLKEKERRKSKREKGEQLSQEEDNTPEKIPATNIKQRKKRTESNPGSNERKIVFDSPKENTPEKMRRRETKQNKNKKECNPSAIEGELVFGSPVVKTPVLKTTEKTPSSGKDWKMRICVSKSSPDDFISPKKGPPRKRRSIKLTFTGITEKPVDGGLLEEKDVEESPKPKLLEEKDVEKSPKPTLLEEKDVEDSPKRTLLEEKDVEESPKPKLLEEKVVEKSPKPTLLEDKDVEDSPKPTLLEEKDVEESPKPKLLEEKDVEKSPKPTSLEEKDVEDSPKPTLLEDKDVESLKSTLLEEKDVEESPKPSLLVEKDVQESLKSTLLEEKDFHESLKSTLLEEKDVEESPKPAQRTNTLANFLKIPVKEEEKKSKDQTACADDIPVKAKEKKLVDKKVRADVPVKERGKKLKNQKACASDIPGKVKRKNSMCEKACANNTPMKAKKKSKDQEACADDIPVKAKEKKLQGKKASADEIPGKANEKKSEDQRACGDNFPVKEKGKKSKNQKAGASDIPGKVKKKNSKSEKACADNTPVKAKKKKSKDQEACADVCHDLVAEKEYDSLVDTSDDEVLFPAVNVSQEVKKKQKMENSEHQEAMIRSRWKTLMGGKIDAKKADVESKKNSRDSGKGKQGRLEKRKRKIIEEEEEVLEVLRRSKRTPKKTAEYLIEDDSEDVVADVESKKNSRDSGKGKQGRLEKRKRKIVDEEEEEEPEVLRRSKRTPKKMAEYLIEDDSEDVVVLKSCEGKRKRPEGVKPSSLEQKVVQQVLKRAKATQNKLADSKLVGPSASKDPKKLAPVFVLKKKKRPDKAFLQAQKVFLNSGVPEEIKKMVDIIKIAEEREHIVFPSVSHVQQRGDGLAWRLPSVVHEFKEEVVDPVSVPELNCECLINISEDPAGKTINAPDKPPKIKLFRSYLQSIKTESPHFPVVRTFKKLRTRVQPPEIKDVAKGGRRGKRRSSGGQRKGKGRAEAVAEPVAEPVASAQWTTKYKPLSSEEIFGNSASVSHLKKWLVLWRRVKETMKEWKESEDSASSGNEFINDESDDEGRQSLPKNTVMLVGPPGSGKTMAVYAVAHELGYKVLEVNASSRRTGKRVLAELLEATQSHQVQSNDQQQHQGIQSFFAKKAPKKAEKPVKKKKQKADEEQPSNKLSLILVEDVDIVFEDQDEGFVSALSTLVSLSKRPVVLVTSDPSCLHLARFLEKSIVLNFNPPPSRLMSVWLQLVCLLEGVRVSHCSVEKLLNSCQNDVRRTLLLLQFWVLSGGNNLPLTAAPAVSTHIADVCDEASNGSWISDEEKETTENVLHPVHTNCESMFFGNSLTSLSLGTLWWNLPSLFDLHVTERKATKKVVEDGSDDSSAPETSKQDGVDIVKDAKEGDSEGETSVEEKSEEKKWRSTCSREDMRSVLCLSENLSSVDVMSASFGSCDSEPIVHSWDKLPTDSLSLNEDMRSCEIGAETMGREISQWILASGVKECLCQLKPANVASACEIAKRLPPDSEISWRKEQHSANNELWSAVPYSYWSERRAVTTDYLPSLRNISRLEQERSILSSKRGNRFFHYLKGLGVHASSSALDTVCKTFDLGIDR